VVEAYPCGTAVLIRFDPDDPRAAFLDAGLSSISNVPLLIGAVLLAVGAGIAILEAL
jgi:riboflavin transporter FmnP